MLKDGVVNVFLGVKSFVGFAPAPINFIGIAN
jgi:hypothetical protein